MAKTRQKKEKELGDLTAGFNQAKAAVFTSFEALTVADSQELRNKLRENKVGLQVSKKTLLKKSLSESKLDVDLADYQGNVAVAFGLEDEVMPAKLISQFVKKHEQLKIRGGLLSGQPISAAKVMELSQLPSKLELIAKTIATIGAPVSGFVNVLAGNLRGLLNVLNGVKESKNQ